MITAVVQFELNGVSTLDEATALFQTTAPRYLGMAGLIRKNYLFDPATGIGGGCYLFESRAAAASVFNAEWRALIAEKYGAEPSVQFFETPVLVDNATDQIIGGAKAAAG